MGYISEEIIPAAASLGVRITEICASEVEEIRDRVADKYAGGRRNATWLWEFMTEGVSINDPDAWTWVGEYVGGIDEVVMFFCPVHEDIGFVFADGNWVIPVLENTISNWEFYLTNKEVDFLLCWNHHQYLIACGKAAEWLRRRIDRLIGDSDLVGG